MALSGPGIVSLGSRKPGLTVFKSGAAAFTPASLSPAAWYKADAGVLDGSGVLTATDATAVGTWQDQSGNGRHLTQSTAGQRPVYKTAIKNGKPVIRFTKTNLTTLKNTSFLGQTQSGIWIFAVLSLASAGTRSGYFSVTGPTLSDFSVGMVCDTGSAALTAFDYVGIEGVKGGTNTDLKTSSQALSTFHTMALDYANATTTTLYVDGTAEGTRGATAATVDCREFRLGSRFFSAAEQAYFDGDFGEVIVLTAAPSSADRASLQAYAKARWATP